MATFIKTTFTAGKISEKGSEAKKLIALLCELVPEWEVVQETYSPSDPTAYNCIIRPFGSEVIYYVSLSGYDLNFKAYYKNPTGVSVINGENYSQTETNGGCLRYLFLQDGQSVNIHIIRAAGTGAFVYMYTSSGYAELVAMKVKDLCSGAVITGVNAYGYSSGNAMTSLRRNTYALIGDTVILLDLKEALPGTVDNGYIRFVPLYCLNTGFFGTILDPNHFYYCASNGAALSLKYGTEFTAGGHRFVSLGTEGYVARLD